MRVCGIDENGLGPYLGPLVVTAYESELVSDEEIKDSKKVFSRKEKDFEFIERFFIESFGLVGNLYDLFEKSELSQEIMNICPFSPETFCFSKIKVPHWASYPVGNKNKDSSIRFIVACPGLLYAKVRELGTKFRTNAYFLCFLALKSNAQKVFCGKSGYKKSYVEELRKVMQDLNLQNQIRVVEESQEQSLYELEGQCKKQIYFIKDADLKFQVVAYASIIGKYIRELCMLSITKFLHNDSKFPMSGYGSRERMKTFAEKILNNLMSKIPDIDKRIAERCIERNY